MPPPAMQLKALAAATALALVMLPAQSHGQSIGALDVRSRLGEPFFGAVPIQAYAGIIDPRCIRVVPNPNAPAGAEALQGTRVRVGSADTVIIETAGRVMSPVVGLRLEVGCDNPVTRDYVVLGEGASVPGLPATTADAGIASSTPASATSVVPIAPSARARTQQRRARATPGVPDSGATAEVRPRPATAPRAAAAAPPRPASSAPAPASTTPVGALTSSATESARAGDAARRVADLRARSDDHAAALLALDDRLALLQKQAELLKAQLEQTLAQAPAALGSTAASAAPASAAPISASVAAPTPSSAAAQAPAALANVATAATATPVALVTPAIPATAAAPSASVSALASGGARGQSVLDLLTDWKVAGGIAALLLGAFAFKLRRRPTFKPVPAVATSSTPWPPALVNDTAAHERTQEVPTFAQPPQPVDTTQWQATTRPLMVDQTAEWIAPPTTDSLPVPETNAATQPASLPGAAMTREFHITQQFQPVAERLVALSSPEEIVQQARTHYMEDGDVFKAIDLLEMAVSARKDSPRPWQALFAIYRRENMPERFQRLVLAYRGTFGQDESWPAISALGHQLDSTNPLYGAAATGEPIPEDLVERWLGVPLDFTAHLLANEMHDQLMETYSGRKRRKRIGRE